MIRDNAHAAQLQEGFQYSSNPYGHVSKNMAYEPNHLARISSNRWEDGLTLDQAIERRCELEDEGMLDTPVYFEALRAEKRLLCFQSNADVAAPGPELGIRAMARYHRSMVA